MRLFTIIALLAASVPASAGARIFDFGTAVSPLEQGAVRVAADTYYTPERGFGWVNGPRLEERDRGAADKLRRDFVYGRSTADFRVDLPKGCYRVTVMTGDSSAGNHVLNVEAEERQAAVGLQPRSGELVEYSFSANVTDGHLDLRFSSPSNNWVLNALEVADAQGPAEPTIRKTWISSRVPADARPAPHNDRLHLIKKPDYAAKDYPNAADFMRILERFPMYGERGWHGNYLDDPKLGYFGDPDHGEMGLRSMGNYIFVTALLATDPAYDPRVSGIPQQTLLARSRACLAYMTRSHVTGDIECGDGFQWGDAWQSAWWTARMAAGARLLWPHLTAEERANVERVVVHEADRHLSRVPPSGAASDTKSEENAWDSEVLAWALGMFPDHDNAPAWRAKLIQFCMNTLSTAADKQDSTVVDGKPVKDWVVTANIHDDFTIENHGAYHFCYMACPLHSLAWGYEGLGSGGEAVPDAMFHHYRDVWRWIKRTYIGEGRFAYLSGKDWPRYAYGLSFVLPATVLAQLRYGDPDARTMERDRIALLEWEQLVNADGSFYGGRFTRNILVGRTAEYETDTYANIALCYLLHRQAKTPAPTDPAKLRHHLAGAWSSPDSGWVFARSPKLFASFSWRHLHGLRPVGLFIPTGCAHMAEWMPDQLVGVFDAEGVDARKAKLRHADKTFRNGFSTTGEIVYPDSAGKPLISRQVSYTALTDEGIAVVIERTTALAPVKLRSSRTVNLAIANDIFNPLLLPLTKGEGNSPLPPLTKGGRGGVRRIACRGNETVLFGARNLGTVEAAEDRANVPSVTLVPVRSPWLCVDDRLGIVLLDGSKEFTIHDCAGRNAPWGSLQYDVISADERGARELRAGESIVDCAFVVIAGDRKASAAVQRASSSGRPVDEGAIRYVTVTAPSGKRYLIVANLDGAARTARIPGYPGLRFEFDGFGAQVRAL